MQQGCPGLGFLSLEELGHREFLNRNRVAQLSGRPLEECPRAPGRVLDRSDALEAKALVVGVQLGVRAEAVQPEPPVTGLGGAVAGPGHQASAVVVSSRPTNSGHSVDVHSVLGAVGPSVREVGIGLRKTG
jgi:hypothetical protein